jgi:hypothetical protein
VITKFRAYGRVCCGTSVTFTEAVLHGSRVSVADQVISEAAGIVAGAV